MLTNQSESEDDESIADAGETKEQSSDTEAFVADVAVVNSQAALLQALQLYSRNLLGSYHLSRIKLYCKKKSGNSI